MEDLEGQIKKPTDEMTPEEMQFHYFKVHDYNNDNKLDGIELISALTHHNGSSLFVVSCILFFVVFSFNFSLDDDDDIHVLPHVVEVQ